MKKIVLTIVAGVAMHAAFAQKAELTSAILDFRNGKLDKAKTEIDNAASNEKSAAMSKTWFYKGEIYRGLMDNPVYKKNAPADAPKIAFEAYEKYLKMDPNGEFAKAASNAKVGLYGTIFNQGVAFYNEKNYDKALETYAIAAQMKPQDTTAYVYSVYAAEAKEDYPRAKELYRQLIGMNHKPLAHYKRMIDITQQVEKNPTETLKLVEEARAKFPADRDLQVLEASLYINTGRGKEAITKLESAIAAETDPKKKSNLYAVLGTLQDQNKNAEAALANYKKAVEADPTNFDAQYNLGVYQFNKAAELYNKTTKMDYATYQKQGVKIENQAKGMFQQAIPYFEAALKIDPTDRASMQSLSQIYVKLGRNADAERMNKMMDATPKKK
jgi:tetratricopeptide (TPR) repeat protein